MTAAAARALARRILWTNWANRQTQQLQLPPSRMTTLENDLIRATIDGEEQDVLAGRVEVGADFLVVVEGKVEVAATLAYLEEDEDADLGGGVGTLPPPPADAILHVIDVACLSDQELDVPGYYVGVSLGDQSSQMHGVDLMESTDGGLNYGFVQELSVEVTCGDASGSLSTTAIPGFWDRASSITVVLVQGTLESVTEDEVLAGANRCLVGDEILAFATATLVATDTYTLTTLLRGLVGTEANIAFHAPNERFVLLSDVGLEFVQIPAGEIGAARMLKAVPVGGDPDDYDGAAFSIAAMNLSPLSPVQVHGTRNAANDLTITWVRRTRAQVRMLGGQAIPLAEEREEYEIEIYDGATVVRVIHVLDSIDYVYSAAAQTADGLTPGDPVDLIIYQISAAVGRGRGASVTI
jgi:hypothetical protein